MTGELRIVDRIWRALDTVHNHEIPLLSIVEMGIVRDIYATPRVVRVVITPPVPDGPLLYALQGAIAGKLNELSYEKIEIVTQYDPPWTPDWITDEGRRRLTTFKLSLVPPDLQLLPLADHVLCPYCASPQPRLRSSFGPVTARRLYDCPSCGHSFEQFTSPLA